MQLDSLSTPMLIVIGVFVVIQLSLEVYAVIDILRRPSERITGGNKWLWLAVVLLVNMIGAIVYLIVGRKPAPETGFVAAPVTGDAAQEAVDALYGPGATK